MWKIWKKSNDLSNLYNLLVQLFDSFYTELKGIPSQSSIGFLTLLEAHRYCEVRHLQITNQYTILRGPKVLGYQCGQN